MQPMPPPPPVPALVVNNQAEVERISATVTFDKEGNPQTSAQFQQIRALKIGDKLEVHVQVPAGFVGHSFEVKYRYEIKTGTSGGICPRPQYQENKRTKTTPSEAKLGVDFRPQLTVDEITTALMEEKQYFVVKKEGLLVPGKLLLPDGGRLLLQPSPDTNRPEYNNRVNDITRMYGAQRGFQILSRRLLPCEQLEQLQVVITRYRRKV
jgi:hypothetical protein